MCTVVVGVVESIDNYPTRDSAGGLCDCFSLSVGSFDICRSRGPSRTLYDPTPETITTERHLVLSVDLDSMDKDDLPRNCHLSWYFMGSAILFVYFSHTDGELRRVQPVSQFILPPV